MLLKRNIALSALLLAASGDGTSAFQTSSSPSISRISSSPSSPSSSLSMAQDTQENSNDDRRAFLTKSTATIATTLGLTFASFASPQTTPAANAVVYLDPAMYGDQENRLSAVDSLKESVRRAILQDPQLAPSFYTLALLDGLSYDAKSGDYGPDGRVIKAVLETTDTSPYVANLKVAANVLIDSKKSLKKLTSITIADAVALGGTEAIEAIGGPNLSIQIGRTDFNPGAKFNPNLPLDLFNGSYESKEVSDAFKRSGLTEREMTALLGALLTLEKVDKDSGASWMKSDKAQFRERGKIGRMSEYKRLTDEDIANAAAAEFEDDDDDEPGLFDDQPYIADTFGTRDQAFGKKTGNLDPKSFNKYLQSVNKTFKSGSADKSLGWIAEVLTDKDLPGTQTWVSKYAQSNINYQKDLGIAFNSLSQLGGEFTGGKYENLLKNKPRKRLNDFD